MVEKYEVSLQDFDLGIAVHPSNLHKWSMKVVSAGNPIHGVAGTRAGRGMQFRLDLPGDVLGSDGLVRMTWRDNTHGQVTVEEDQSLCVMTRIASISRDRGKEVVWGDGEAWEKMCAMWERHGFALTESEQAPMRIGTAEHRVSAFRDVLAHVTVVDQELAQRAFDNGVGRRKIHGFGMLLVCDEGELL